MLNSQIQQTQDYPVSENNLLSSNLPSPNLPSPNLLIPMSSKLTKSQQAVLDLLKDVPNAIAAQDVFMLLRQTRSIGLATVYRSMEALKMRGIVKCVIGAQGEALYSLINRDTHHIKCLHCHQSVKLENCPLPSVPHYLQDNQQFKIYYHTLEFFGICPACQATESTTDENLSSVTGC
jgi:Fur family transcriptional regulator, ferric uptake regulator